MVKIRTRSRLTRFVGVLVTGDTHEKLRVTAEKYNTSVAEMMRDIITDFLENEDKNTVGESGGESDYLRWLHHLEVKEEKGI